MGATYRSIVSFEDNKKFFERIVSYMREFKSRFNTFKPPTRDESHTLLKVVEVCVNQIHEQVVPWSVWQQVDSYERESNALERKLTNAKAELPQDLAKEVIDFVLKWYPIFEPFQKITYDVFPGEDHLRKTKGFKA